MAERRYVVVGAGAVGSSLGGHLSRTGQDVLLVARGEHGTVLRERGLRLVTPDETLDLRLPTAGSVGELGFRPSDVVLLCVKSQDTQGALQQLRAGGANLRTVPIVCFQNGIANEDMALRYARNVYGAVVSGTSFFLEPGVVHNAMQGGAGVLVLGRFPRGVDPFLEDFAGTLRRATYAVQLHPDILRAKAAKLITNLGNAVLAITDGRGDVEACLAAARAEGQRVLDAAGIPVDERPARADAADHPRLALPAGFRVVGSTWQSMTRGAASIETDFLNGEIVRLGRLHGVPSPINEVLQEVAQRVHRLRQRPGAHSADELLQLARIREQEYHSAG